jgi:hypothetical protein
MKTLVSAIALTLTFNASGTEYCASRLITPEFDTFNVEGSASVLDTGPYTPMEHISAEVYTIPCDDGSGTLFASPAPPQCSPIVIEGAVLKYSRTGHMYWIAGLEEPLSIIRRGSEETNDPSLIMMIGDIVTVFTECETH